MQCQGLLVEVKDAGLHAGQGVLTPWNLVKGPEQFARILQSCLAALADFQAPCVLLTAGGRVGVTRTQHNHLQTSHPTPWLASSASPSPPVPVCSWQSFINLKKKKKPNPDFPGSPIVNTLCFHYSRHRIDPWSGKSHMRLITAKKEIPTYSS